MDKKTENAELAAAAAELGSEASAIIEAEVNPDAAAAPYTIKLRRPVKYDGNEIAVLHFDFDSLTGQDSREVQRELNRKGISVLVQSVTEEFMRPMAARACTDELPDGRKIGADIFDLMTVGDVNKVLARLRRFL
jgi:hypothetical protein